MDSSGGNDESQLHIQGSYEPNTEEVVEEEAVYDDFHLVYQAGHEPHTDQNNLVPPQHEGQRSDHEFMQGSLGNMPEGVGGRRGDLLREHHRLPSIEIDDEVEGAIEGIRMQTDDILSDDLMEMEMRVEEIRPRQRSMYQIHNPNAIGPGARIDAQSAENRRGLSYLRGRPKQQRQSYLRLFEEPYQSMRRPDLRHALGAPRGPLPGREKRYSGDGMRIVRTQMGRAPANARPGVPVEGKSMSSGTEATSAEERVEGGEGTMSQGRMFVKMAEGIDNSLATERVPMADIDDGLYDALSTAILDAKSPTHPEIGLADADEATEAMQRRLAFLYHSGDWAASRHYSDAYIGEVDTMLVHLPTRRFLPRPDFRNTILKMLITLHKNDKNPVGCALEVIRKNYIGFPPVIQLRNSLIAELAACFPNSRSIHVAVATPIRGGYSRSSRPTPKTARKVYSGHGIAKVKEGGGDEETPSAPVSKGDENVPEEDGRGLLNDSPLPDELYDLYARVMAEKATIEEMADIAVAGAIAAARRGDLISEYQEEPCEWLEAGWRIRERTTGRIIPKRSQVAQIWDRARRVMSSTSTLAQICAAVDARFVGVTNESLIRLARTQDIFKGARVAFPMPPSVIGSRPMQYVQIDITGMEHSAYPDGEYVALLMVTDLYSSFAWAHPLYRDAAADALSEVEGVDSYMGVATSSIMKHLSAVFSSFGPPEAYRSYTNQFTIHDCMAEMAIFFKTNLRNIGLGPALSSHQRIRQDAYRRADLDLGDRNRWVETSSFAAIAHNQIAADAFDYQFSPFEVMFGRRPWRDVMMEKEGGEAAGQRAGGGDSKKERIPPPWLAGIDPTSSDPLKRRTLTPREDAAIVSAVKEAREEAEGGEASTDSAGDWEGAGIGRLEVPIVDTRRRVRKVLASSYVVRYAMVNVEGEQEEREGDRGEAPGGGQRQSDPPKKRQRRALVDPGTGVKYAVGDHVYVRNLHFVRAPSASEALMARRTSPPVPDPTTIRYFRGTIAEVDDASPCFPYRIIFWHDVANIDALAPALWPSLEDDMRVDAECSDSWCAPWDVAPANADLLARRSSRRAAASLGACACFLVDPSDAPLHGRCEQPRTKGCERGMAGGCCVRAGGCAVHRIPKKEVLEAVRSPAGRKSAAKREAEGAGGGGLNKLSRRDDFRPMAPPAPPPPRTAAPNERYIFQGGRTVPIVPYTPSSIASSSRGRGGGGGVRRGGEGGGLLSSSGRLLRLAAPMPGRFTELAVKFGGGQGDTPRPRSRGGANLLNSRMGRGPGRPRKFPVTLTRPLMEGKQEEESDSTSVPAEEDEQ